MAAVPGVAEGDAVRGRMGSHSPDDTDVPVCTAATHTQTHTHTYTHTQREHNGWGNAREPQAGRTYARDNRPVLKAGFNA